MPFRLLKSKPPLIRHAIHTRALLHHGFTLRTTNLILYTHSNPLTHKRTNCRFSDWSGVANIIRISNIDSNFMRWIDSFENHICKIQIQIANLEYPIEHTKRTRSLTFMERAYLEHRLSVQKSPNDYNWTKFKRIFGRCQCHLEFELENVVVSAECIKSIRQTDIKLDYRYHLIFTYRLRYFLNDFPNTLNPTHLFSTRISSQNPTQTIHNCHFAYFKWLEIAWM